MKNPVQWRKPMVASGLLLALLFLLLCFISFPAGRNNNSLTLSFHPEHLRTETKCRCSNFAELIVTVDKKEGSSNKCLDLLRRFFELEVRHSDIMTIPETFQPRVKEWLGGNDKLYNNLLKQSLLHAHSLYTHSTTVYNPLRASRPLPKVDKNPADFVEEYLNATSGDVCDFCHFRESTAEDSFGRFESDLAATASNAFKVQDFHSLVFPKRHRMIDLSLEEFEETFKLAEMWFARVNSISPSHTHPHLIFDALAHAGVSQAHPHLHTIMGEGHYLGQFQTLEQAQKTYKRTHGKCSFMTDFVQAHLDVGLGVKIGDDTAVIVPMDAHKDHEFLIISPSAGRGWLKAFYAVYKAYVDELKVYCWSAGFAWPSLGEEDKECSMSSLPAIARIGSRGNCMSMTSDVSSLELYLMYNVNTNPFKTVEALKAAVKKLGYK